MTSLEDNVVNLVLAFLDRSLLNGGQFGKSLAATGHVRPPWFELCMYERSQGVR